MDGGTFFDAQAAWYDREYDRPTASGRVLRARLETVLSLLGPGPGTAVDVGMGAGRLCAELDRLGWTVTGIDASTEMVTLARARLPHLAPRLLPGRLERLPLGDGSMDAVIATGVLEYAGDLEAALRELARVLRPGGVVALSIPAPNAPHILWRLRVVNPLVRAVKTIAPFGRPAPPPRRPMSRGALASAAASAGLALVRELRVGSRAKPGRLATRQLVYEARQR